MFCLNGRLFSKKTLKGSAALNFFFKIEGGLKYAISSLDRGLGHHYLPENDAFSLYSYTKTRLHLYICFEHNIKQLINFLKIDIVLKNMCLRLCFGSLNIPLSG